MKPFRFGFIGEYQSGKSLLTNCLLRRSIATVGGGNATTHTVVNYRYGEKEHVEYVDDKQEHHCIPMNELKKLDTATNIEVVDIYLTIDFLKSYTLTDMPGFGANAVDNEIARKALPDIDFAILIASSDKSFGEEADSFRNLRALKAHRIPYYFVLNCTKIDRWRCDDEGNMVIAQKDFGMMSFYPPSRYPLETSGINIVNLMWYWYSISESTDELINRTGNRNAFDEYGINPLLKKQLGDVSNFELINRLFNMEHKDFLELKRSFREEINELKRELCPIGTIQAFALNHIPEGWMVCDGSILFINEYPDLFNAVGHTFGGNGKTNFAIPDLRGRFIRGWDDTGKLDAKREFGSYQEDAFQTHAHGFNSSVLQTDSNGRHFHYTYAYWNYVGTWGPDKKALQNLRKQSENYDDQGGTDYDGSHTHTIQSTSPGKEITEPIQFGKSDIRVAKETRPHNVALMFCIKIK